MVLISGVGIAGPTLAYWLSEHGIESTLIERARHLRTGGYAIDFWGRGYDIAEKMGLLPDIRKDGYNVKELRLINERGSRVGGFNVDIFRTATGGRYVSIPRGDLAKDIYKTIEDRCEIIFGDTITGIQQNADGVEVAFQHTRPRLFDTIIGADGLHSVVRKLAFGNQDRFERFLGYSVAAFDVAGYQPRDEDIYISCTCPGRQVGRLSMRNDRTLFLFIFADEHGNLSDSDHTKTSKEVLRSRFGDIGWECPHILDAMESCDEIYFDRVSQIRMDTWFKGRIGLIGDAAFCPSLLAGQGSALAMISAYVLAGELGKTPNLPQEAFRRYESLLRPFMLAKQKAAQKFARSFAPKTPWGLFLRNQITRLFAIPFVPRLLMVSSLLDRIDLPDYSRTARSCK